MILSNLLRLRIASQISTYSRSISFAEEQMNRLRHTTTQPDVRSLASTASMSKSAQTLLDDIHNGLGLVRRNMLPPKPRIPAVTEMCDLYYAHRGSIVSAHFNCQWMGPEDLSYASECTELLF